jgi:hypothetical protein
VLLGLLARDTEPPLHYGPNRTPRAEPLRDYDRFDRAEFVRHMRGRIDARDRERERAARRRREAEEERRSAEEARALLWRERERRALDDIMRSEEAGGHFAPPPPPRPPAPPRQSGDTVTIRLPEPWQPPLSIPPAYQQWHNVEPWFHPARTPTPDDVHEIALYAMHYLTAALRPTCDGLLWLGGQQTAIVCDRNADAIAGALMRFSRALPAGAVLSTETDLMPAGVVGTEATSRFLAVRVLSIDEGRKVEIGLTWDLIPP